jgi:hypothetical protein
VGPLLAAAEGEGFEVVCRAVHVLRQMSVADDASTADEAHLALERLAGSSTTAAASRASAALRFHRSVRSQRAAALVQSMGGQIAPENPATEIRNPAQLLIGSAWTGGDDGLAHLKWVADINWLSLHNAPLTDAAVPHLKQLTSLNRLELYGTKISDEGVAELRAALTETVIDRRRGALLGVHSNKGQPNCQVIMVQPGSAADNAGVQAGDIITHFDGQAVQTFDDLTALISQKHGGDKVSMELLRGEERLTVEAVLGQWK